MEEFEKYRKEQGIGYPAANLTERGWRAAFELMSKWLEIEESYEAFHARIKNELGDT